MGRKSILGLILFAALISGFLVYGMQAEAQPQKPKIGAACKQCHAPDEKLLRGTIGNVSEKAETIQVNAGAIWLVKFDDKTKLIGWGQAINKIPREKEISIEIYQKDGDFYAKSVSVKPPAKIDPSKLVDADFVAEHIEIGDAIIIDSRPPARFNEGAIPTAINIYDADFDKQVGKLPKEKNKLIIFYCAGPT